SVPKPPSPPAIAPATSCASPTPPALAREVAGRRSGGLTGLRLVGGLLVGRLLVGRLLVGLLLDLMMVVVMRMMMLHRLRCPHGRSGEGGRDGESAEQGLQFGNVHGEISFLPPETSGFPRRLNAACPAPEQRQVTHR